MHAFDARTLTLSAISFLQDNASEMTRGVETTAVVLLLIVLGVVVFWCLIPSWLCMAFTAERGHSKAIGFVLGLLFGWIAVLFCSLMPYKQYGRGYDRGSRDSSRGDRSRRRRTRR